MKYSFLIQAAIFAMTVSLMLLAINTLQAPLGPVLAGAVGFLGALGVVAFMPSEQNHTARKPPPRPPNNDAA